MGSCFSAVDDSDTDSSDEIRTNYSWDKKEQVDKELLSIHDQHDGGVVGRLPGQLNGRQFKITNCSSLQVWVLDHTSTVTIENCRDCQIFVGPTKASLYVRECEKCQFVVACQQFRVRDCKNLYVSLFTASQPVMESSTKIKFSCFQCYYPQLRGQFEASGLSVFNNYWHCVHDFDGGSANGHWTVLSRDSAPKLHPPDKSEFADVGVTFQPESSLVPYTVGSSSVGSEEDAGLVIFFESDSYEAKALEFVKELHDQKIVLGLTRLASLQTHQVHQIFPGDEALHARTNEGPLKMIILEACGQGSLEYSLERLGDLVSSGHAYVSSDPEQGAQDIQTLRTISDISLTM